MENNTNASTAQITPNVLTNKVKDLKIIARNALRMELINPILAEISKLERKVKTIAEMSADRNHKINVAKYKIARLERFDAEHPDFKAIKEELEAFIRIYKEGIETLNKENENILKRIAEEKEAIAKIERGETKVCADRLEETVNKLIIQDAKDTIAKNTESTS